MKRKLKSTRGETLVEVLASILIGALSLMLLLGAVGASVSMDKTARAADKTFGESLSKAEKQDTPIADTAIVPAGAGTVTVQGSGGAAATPPVSFYGGEGALSYVLKP